MKHILKMTLAASTVAILMAAIGPATAAGLSIDFGNVAFGYSDGYWDHDHHWHGWSARDARAYRSKYHDHYTAMRHDRAPNQGWRDH